MPFLDVVACDELILDMQLGVLNVLVVCAATALLYNDWFEFIYLSIMFCSISPLYDHGYTAQPLQLIPPICLLFTLKLLFIVMHAPSLKCFISETPGLVSASEWTMGDWKYTVIIWRGCRCNAFRWQSEFDISFSS